ncbi:hypothetical protein GGF46_002414 [Coemansia sp. RSA 552]|nr:hypothetical protein GGF46_002414 [Coemansia sp. RSA 552]
MSMHFNHIPDNFDFGYLPGCDDVHPTEVIVVEWPGNTADELRSEILTRFNLDSIIFHGYNKDTIAECSEDSGGEGIAAGYAWFTTKNGDTLKVIQKYAKVSDTKGKEFKDYMDKLTEYAKNESGSTKGLDGLCGAWEEAAQNEDFRTAQYDLNHQIYYKPARDLAHKMGAKSMLIIGSC